MLKINLSLETNDYDPSDNPGSGKHTITKTAEFVVPIDNLNGPSEISLLDMYEDFEKYIQAKVIKLK